MEEIRIADLQLRTLRRYDNGHHSAFLAKNSAPLLRALRRQPGRRRGLGQGGSPSHLGTFPVSLFWSLAARGSTLWWVEYVNAKSNISDAPSRACSNPAKSTCASQSGEVTAVFDEVFRSLGTLRRGPLS